jgi:hypothetical protein
MNPLQYAVYKGTGGKWGAVQFNLQAPHYFKDKQKDFTGELAFGDDGKFKEGWKIREGAVFLEITSTKEKNVYDWENKVTVALSTNDLGKVLFGLKTGNEVKLLHDPGAKSEKAGEVTKTVNISSPNGTAEGCMVRVSQKTGEVVKTHTVPLTGDEVLVLATLVQAAISRSLGW